MVYVAGLVGFNVALLFVFKSDALAAISASFGGSCAVVPGSDQITVEQCFDALVSIYPEYLGFICFFVVLPIAGAFGWENDALPGRSAVAKGEVAAVASGVALLGLGLTGPQFTQIVAVLLGSFLVVWTLLYGFVLGRLYERYTRRVKIDSSGIDGLRVTVDGKDLTGRERTFAAKSVHRLRAEVSGGRSFKGWSVSGGVTLDDARSFETEMEVNGNGLVRGEAG